MRAKQPTLSADAHDSTRAYVGQSKQCRLDGLKSRISLLELRFATHLQLNSIASNAYERVTAAANLEHRIGQDVAPANDDHQPTF